MKTKDALLAKKQKLLQKYCRCLEKRNKLIKKIKEIENQIDFLEISKKYL